MLRVHSTQQTRAGHVLLTSCACPSCWSGGRPEVSAIPPSVPSFCFFSSPRLVFGERFAFSPSVPFLLSSWRLHAFAFPHLGHWAEEKTNKSWRSEGRNICEDVHPLTVLGAVSLLYFPLFSPRVPGLCRVAYRRLYQMQQESSGCAPSVHRLKKIQFWFLKME